MKTLYPTLVRRELWEHRALWLTPVIVAGLTSVSRASWPGVISRSVMSATRAR